MKILRVAFVCVVTSVAVLAMGCGSDHLSGTPASNVMWQGGLGMDPAYPNRLYVLLGAGFLRAPTSDDLDKVVADWTEQHPQAQVVLAADYGPMFTDHPDSKLYWAWVLDGEACLNIELVRLGACSAGTMAIPAIPTIPDLLDSDSTQLLVSEEQYESFRSEALEAEDSAREERLGVWADSPRTETSSDDTWSIAEPWAGPEPTPPVLFPVRRGTKWGYIDRTGTLVVEFTYDDAGGFSDGLAPVKVGGTWGCIDEEGTMVITPKYEEALVFNNGLARVWWGAEPGYIDKSGEVVIHDDPEWDGTYGFGEGLAGVLFEYTMYSDWGYIDTSGELVIKIAGADSGREFSEGLAVVRKGGYGYIDRSGQFVIGPRFYYAEDFSDGLAVVQYESSFDGEDLRVDKRFEIIDTGGEVVKQLEYDHVFGLSEGRAAVQDYQGKWPDGVSWWGYVDGSGELVIPMKFKIAGEFCGGLAYVEDEDGKMGYIDLDGDYVWREQ